MSINYSVDAAIACIRESSHLIEEGSVEGAIRQRFSAHLSRIFPAEPWWVKLHGTGAEHHVRYNREGTQVGGFVDTLIGNTVIEYEKNISSPQIYSHGLDQVKDYCAGLLNQGGMAEHIVGILSDTIRWRAYKIKSTPVLETPGVVLGRDHIQLEEIESIHLVDADETNARKLISFLTRYLGREGARQLNAHTLEKDLGFDSEFCAQHVKRLSELVDHAFVSNEMYGDLIRKLWGDFVTFIGEDFENGLFSREVYTKELYVLTLAKLLCANIIDKKALDSSSEELLSILNGNYFKMKGLGNLVEYDYFGWLNDLPYVSSLIPVATDMQRDLRAYDFLTLPNEDLFGPILAQLARHSQRLLLGQEWTPSWLASALVREVFEQIPVDQDPRLVDMCCGSGSMVIEVVKLTLQRFEELGVRQDESYISRLSHAVTGFDIDPLAVLLSKVNWVISAREKLEPFGTYQVTIPIYHADSLFALPPLAKNNFANPEVAVYELLLADKSVSLPAFLISPDRRALFDSLLGKSYEVAMSSSKHETTIYSRNLPENLLKQSEDDAGIVLVDAEKQSALAFVDELIVSLEALQREGKNGVWAFILRNSYRPGLVTGIFNGIVSNPPWLALSKISENPYKESLKAKAEFYNIKPPGPSHLHIELATIFLLHAIQQYLCEGGAVGCILPESLLNGHHHNPFRKEGYKTGGNPVQFSIDKIWRIEKGTFKNEAIVLYGKKISDIENSLTISGEHVSQERTSPLIFNKIIQGNRVAWSEKLNNLAGMIGFFEPADFRQGADIMPRTLIFHELLKSRNKKWTLGPINRQESEFKYLVADAKKHKHFSLPQCVISDQFVFDVMMSNHLTPFDLSKPAKGFLPIRKNVDGIWQPLHPAELATSQVEAQAFNRIFSEIGMNVGLEDFFQLLDSNRRKLTSQVIPENKWIVYMGAGGNYVCAAYSGPDTNLFEIRKLIIDQTLYWSSVDTEDEAIYLTGLLNSDAVNEVIKEFQPRGQFGPRHVHKLPIGVTPKFNPNEAGHVNVVETTRNLIVEWNALKTVDAEIASYLNPNKKLSQRRTYLRNKIKALQSYDNYADACRSLYGI